MSDTTEGNGPTFITLPPRDQRFHQGVAVGNQVLEAHKDLPFPDQNTRRALFYFYAGALAASEHGCETNEDFEPFLMGLALRAPAGEPVEQHMTKPLEDALYTFELRASEDDVKTDLEVTCMNCSEVVCDAQHGDTIDVLARTVLDHKCDGEED